VTVVAFEESSVAVTVEPIDASVAQAFCVRPFCASLPALLFAMPLVLRPGLVACSAAGIVAVAFEDEAVEVVVVVESLPEAEFAFEILNHFNKYSIHIELRSILN
jgi:hypothetical protein